ncbi:Transcription factor TFIIB cyclin-releated protein [Halococcus morrhuae DSM 1307]|uniref:Transcription initiation factor IIB n=2 Tax=Halococcus morrhuae TaxID=2250 RepID=M0MMM8_HALMO|nr:Transcription factor TFIIB cyclin-releated protein [Halococcus morrhuae DSM 1307]
MAEALDVLETIAKRLDLGREAREQTVEVYVEAALSNLPDGRSTELTVAAAIVHGTRASGEPRPSGCIAESAAVEADSLHRVSNFLSRELDRPVVFCPPEDYLEYLSGELQLDTSTVAGAEQMLGAIDGSVLAGKDPVGFAGAALYLAAGGEVTQREIARITGITTETLRVRVRDCRTAEEVS